MRAGNSGGVPQNADHVSNLYIVMYAVNYTQLRTTNGWYKPSTYGWFIIALLTLMDIINWQIVGI